MIQYIYSLPLQRLSIISVIIIICDAFINLCLNNQIWKFVFNRVVLIVSIFALIYITVLRRSEGNYQIDLTPLHTFFLAQQKPEMYRSFFMNCLLFVPLGLSMPYVLSNKPRKRNLFITIGVACVLSAGIEFCQYYYHLGRCETDDVIANTLGAAVGTLSYLLYIRILKNRKENLMNSKITDNQKLLLDLCAKSLFDKNIEFPEQFDCKELVLEANQQTVFPLVFSLIKDRLDHSAQKRFSQIIAKNIRVEYAHNEIHNIFVKNNIPYIVLKGVSSASYYKEPVLRTMGDVDVFVEPQNIPKADLLLKSIGFVTTDDINGDDMHIGYNRNDGVACELHRKIGWMPQNEMGENILKSFSEIFEKGKIYNNSTGCCIIPDKFHHGLILLLHTATHLTHEGVGLRHLCDWAVFVNGFSDDEFVALFDSSLKEMGLWHFAQLLTLCCIKYLGCDVKDWAGEAEEDLLDSIISDILNGGNFGYKDSKRYSHIKYIFDRKSGETSNKNLVFQLINSINEKTKKEFKFVNKSKFLLPVGWLFTVCKYIYMVIVGKRNLDNRSVISGANQRKNIYDEFKLFSEE